MTEMPPPLLPDPAFDALCAEPDHAVVFAPDGLVSGATAETALATGMAAPLPGTGAQAFTLVRALVTTPRGDHAATLFPVTTPPPPLAEAWAAWQAGLLQPRPPLHPALPRDRPAVMGIVNVTPDSFSDGGLYIDPGQAIAHGRLLAAAGADLLDVGGESTRPGAAPVPPDEEQARIMPVIEALAGDGALVSVDTRNAATMAAALDAGAAIVNDVTALTGDPASLDLVIARSCPTILMHMQGEPQTMQTNPTYVRAPADIHRWLAARLDAVRTRATERGRAIPPLAVDPGIGFGKTLAHNLDVLAHLTVFHGLGVPVLLGASRKSFIGKLSAGEAAPDRIPGSLAVALAGAGAGLQLLRVHDVAETVQALAVARAVDAAG